MKTVLVVPCFNEAERIASDQMRALPADVRIVFVNDGSSDGTGEMLDSLARAHGHVVLHLPSNSGKGEAVRHGMLHALVLGPTYVGYWDADGATPFAVVADFVAQLDRDPDIMLLMGSRVRMLGWHIERRAARHYLGRIIATIVSMMLRLPVYDTQCGAKLFRNSTSLQTVFADPFISRWLFDVEIIARMKHHHDWRGAVAERHIRERPLPAWCDVGKSRIGAGDLFRIPLDLLKLWRAIG